jgi:excinuclease ABC subunit A
MEFVHPQKGKWMEQVEWRGVLYDAKQRYGAAQSDVYKKNMEPYLQETICPSCLGSRLKPYPSHAKLHGKTIQEVTDLSIEEAFTSNCRRAPQRDLSKTYFFKKSRA